MVNGNNTSPRGPGGAPTSKIANFVSSLAVFFSSDADDDADDDDDDGDAEENEEEAIGGWVGAFTDDED